MIGKKTEHVVNNNLQVEGWEVKYVENKDTGVADLTEQCQGKVNKEKADENWFCYFFYGS